jgi:hypothetical protein
MTSSPADFERLCAQVCYNAHMRSFVRPESHTLCGFAPDFTQAITHVRARFLDFRSDTLR